jgi:Tol biopolymer transport system component
LQSSPFISHDGRWVAFREVLVDGSAALYVASSEGGPAKELVRVKSPATFINPRGLGWSPDDRFIFFLRRPDDSSPSELFRVPVSGGSEESTGLKGLGLGAAEIAPDGKRIVIGAINQQTEIWAMENFLPSPAAKK